MDSPGGDGRRAARSKRTRPPPIDIAPSISTQPEPDVEDRFARSVVRFQAHARGFVVRQKVLQMYIYYGRHEREVIRAQAVWRGVRVRRRVKPLLEQMRQQAEYRRLMEEEERLRLEIEKEKKAVYEERHLRAAATIQRSWRQFKARNEFEDNLRSGEVRLAVIRRYLHLLEINVDDFDYELELRELKGEISKAIRLNRHLEKDVDQMDIKIGLLVKNRISVQDVVAVKNAAFSTLQRKATFNHGTVAEKDHSTLSRAGLKALKKESRDKLDAYQHLFYLLQTEPTYLARLVFVMPQMKTTKFLESVILSLYNFGANQREEFMLLRLFRTALEEEVKNKVDRIGDIVTGQPMVVKMIVSYNRNCVKGQMCLREMLGPLITRVLEDKSLRISTNPVEIYKQWINQMEFDSGKNCGLPYDVTAEKALEHEEVRRRLERSVTQLKQVATLFLTTICKSKAKLPYGLLYMAKVLFRALKKKFPAEKDKEILKVS